MMPQEKEREVAERIEAAAHALFGLPRDERSRRGPPGTDGILAQLTAPPPGKGKKTTHTTPRPDGERARG